MKTFLDPQYGDVVIQNFNFIAEDHKINIEIGHKKVLSLMLLLLETSKVDFNDE